MTQAPVTHVAYTLPLADLLSLGKALYLADPHSLEEKGLAGQDADAVQRVFEAIDAALEGFVGPDWLEGLEDEEGERDLPDNVVRLTPFASLVNSLPKP